MMVIQQFADKASTSVTYHNTCFTTTIDKRNFINGLFFTLRPETLASCKKDLEDCTRFYMELHYD